MWKEINSIQAWWAIKHLEILDHAFFVNHKLHKHENPFMQPEIIVQSLKSPQALEQSLSMNNKTLVI